MYCLALFLAFQAPSPDSLTIEAALALAESRRPAFAITAATVDLARAGIGSAGTIPNPTLSYSHTQSAPGDHLLVDQSLDFLLTRGPDRQAALLGVGRARADSSARRAELRAEVTVAYYRALAAGQALDAVTTQARLADSLAVLADQRLRAGDISEFERDQLSLEAGRARGLLSTAREESSLASLALARLLGWPPGSGLPPLVGTLDAGLDEVMSTSASDSLLLPSIRGAVADSAAAAIQLRSAHLAAIPMPSLQAGVEWNDPSLPGRSLSVIGLAIPLPVWNQNGGRAGEARARAAQASLAVAEARLEASQRVRAAEASLRESAARARESKERLAPLAHRLAARAAQAYTAGETGILPVLDALRSERESTLDLLRDLLAFQTARAEWNSLTESSR